MLHFSEPAAPGLKLLWTKKRIEYLPSVNLGLSFLSFWENNLKLKMIKYVKYDKIIVAQRSKQTIGHSKILEISEILTFGTSMIYWKVILPKSQNKQFRNTI